jgi:hypothetical protein
MYGNWQPIGTAPKDGRRILTYAHDHAPEGIMRVAQWNDGSNAKGWLGSVHEPTHWMPLPSPPKAA